MARPNLRQASRRGVGDSLADRAAESLTLLKAHANGDMWRHALERECRHMSVVARCGGCVCAHACNATLIGRVEELQGFRQELRALLPEEQDMRAARTHAEGAG